MRFRSYNKDFDRVDYDAIDVVLFVAINCSLLSGLVTSIVWVGQWYYGASQPFPAGMSVS